MTMDLDVLAVAGLSSTLATVTTARAAHGGGFEDTLRDMKAVRYGHIVIYRSGRAELIIGEQGGWGGRMMIWADICMPLTEVLRCGFSRQAVAINSDIGSFISLGEVQKDLVATPDVKGEFSDN